MRTKLLHLFVTLTLTLSVFGVALPAAMPATLLGAAPDGGDITTVSGPISSNTTWALANSPYIVTNSILVMDGITLTIEPGLEVNA